MIILLSITRQFVYTQGVRTTGTTNVWSFNAHIVQNEREPKTLTSVLYDVK